MKEKMTYKQCLFAICMSIIVELVQRRLLIPIACKYPVNDRGIHTQPVNGYFRIKGTNFVWMHVQNGYGIIINQYVRTMRGKCINIVDELSKHYWYIENNTGIIKSWSLDNRAIYRCIASIIVYDNINKKLPHYYEVHHKWRRWCNTQNTITVTSYEEHQYFHNCIDSRKSHKKGVVIRDVKDFMDWKRVIKYEDLMFKYKKM